MLFRSAFGEASSLTRHVRAVHEKRRDHACPQCDAAFGQAGDLRVHVRTVHEQCRDHACSQCDAAFGQACHLSRHVRTVHGDHTCRYCAGTFGTARGLTTHVRVVHTKPWGCAHCTRTFGTTTSLRLHVHACHGNRPMCKVCHVTFLAPSDLGVHTSKRNRAMLMTMDELNKTPSRKNGCPAIADFGALATVDMKTLFAAPNIASLYALMTWRENVRLPVARLALLNWMGDRCWRETAPELVKEEEELEEGEAAGAAPPAPRSS